MERTVRSGSAGRAAVVSGILIAALAVGACTPAAMVVPEELGSAERLAVEGRGGFRQAKRIDFGEFAAAGIDRSWTRGSGWTVGVGAVGADRQRRRQTYSFELLAEEQSLGRVDCEVEANDGTLLSAVVDIDAESREALRCHLVPVTGAGWELEMAARQQRHLSGTLGAGDARYEIVGTGPGGRYAPAETFGFEIRSADEVLAAVETANRGAVWLAPALAPDDRRVLAGAAAALLLFQSLPTDD